MLSHILYCWRSWFLIFIKWTTSTGCVLLSILDEYFQHYFFIIPLLLTLTFTQARAAVSFYGEHCFSRWHVLIVCLVSSTGWWCSRYSSTVGNRRAIHRCTGKLGCEEGKHPRFALSTRSSVRLSVHLSFHPSIHPSMEIWAFLLMSSRYVLLHFYWTFIYFAFIVNVILWGQVEEQEKSKWSRRIYVKCIISIKMCLSHFLTRSGDQEGHSTVCVIWWGGDGAGEGGGLCPTACECGAGGRIFESNEEDSTEERRTSDRGVWCCHSSWDTRWKNKRLT